jgi:hypothetical protein
MRRMRKPRSHPRFSVSGATSLPRSTFELAFGMKRAKVLIESESRSAGYRCLFSREVHGAGAVFGHCSCEMPWTIIPFICQCENESNPWILPSVFQTRDEFISKVASCFPSRTNRNAGVFWRGCFKLQKSLRSQSRVKKGRRKFLELNWATAPGLTRSKKLLIALPGY